MVRLLLGSRSQIYANPDLAGVSDHGCNRINQKLQQILKKICVTYPGAEKIVEEEVEGLKKVKGSGLGAKTPSPKKRKAKDELDDDH
jgi:hypothetical protein